MDYSRRASSTSDYATSLQDENNPQTYDSSFDYNYEDRRRFISGLLEDLSRGKFHKRLEGNPSESSLLRRHAYDEINDEPSKESESGSKDAKTMQDESDDQQGDSDYVGDHEKRSPKLRKQHGLLGGGILNYLQR